MTKKQFSRKLKRIGKHTIFRLITGVAIGTTCKFLLTEDNLFHNGKKESILPDWILFGIIPLANALPKTSDRLRWSEQDITILETEIDLLKAEINTLKSK